MIFTVRQQSCGKVMFSLVCVCLQGVCVSLIPCPFLGECICLVPSPFQGVGMHRLRYLWGLVCLVPDQEMGGRAWYQVPSRGWVYHRERVSIPGGGCTRGGVGILGRYTPGGYTPLWKVHPQKIHSLEGSIPWKVHPLVLTSSGGN